MRLGLDERAVHVAGDQVLRRVVRNQVQQLHQRLDIAVLAEHVPRHHHAGIAQRPKRRFDRLLFLAQPGAVQVADMQDGIFLQVRRQVQDRQPDLVNPHIPRNRDIGNKKSQHQEGNHDQDRPEDPMGPFEPVPVRRENILVFLPPHTAPPLRIAPRIVSQSALKNKAFGVPDSGDPGFL